MVAHIPLELLGASSGRFLTFWQHLGGCHQQRRNHLDEGTVAGRLKLKHSTGRVCGAGRIRLGRTSAAVALVRSFADMMTHPHGERLTAWMTAAEQAALPGISRFATGLNADLAAVIAGLSLSFNSGPVEGNVNRIKMIKRQMYGRAGFDLLRKRVLLAG